MHDLLDQKEANVVAAVLLESTLNVLISYH